MSTQGAPTSSPSSSSPSASFGQSLGSLFDVAGVYGSFLVTPAGTVAGRALPEIFDDATLAEVGGRVIRLGDTFQATGLSPEMCVLRFTDHKLYVKTLPGGLLCIVTGSDVSAPALRMAANLIARKVGPELVRAAAAGVMPPPPLSVAAAKTRTSSSGSAALAGSPPQGSGTRAAATTTTTAAAAGRMYRGRPMS